jgi:Protein of unknown function (DUF4007)
LLWVDKKGFDRTLQDGEVFLKDDATATLGIEKNMMRSIRYKCTAQHGCTAFEVLEEVQEKSERVQVLRPTSFGRKLLADDG